MPQITAYESALLSAHCLNDGDGTATGAIYASDGRLIEESVRPTAKADAHQPSDPERVPRPSAVIGRYNHDGYDMYIDEAVFGGNIFVGWGHNITETISTAWAADEVPADLPLVMVPWGRLWMAGLDRIREVMSLAGWGDRPLILASGSVLFGKVHIPERLVRFDDLLDRGASIPKRMNSVYDLMIGSSLDAKPEVKLPTFLARTRGHRRAHGQEMAVELALQDKGYRVVEGWDMTVKEQISLINSSSVLVAFSGSSLHNSVFANRGVGVVEIMDSRASAAGWELQASLCTLREQQFKRVEGYDGGKERSLGEIVSEIVDFASSVSTPEH